MFGKLLSRLTSPSVSEARVEPKLTPDPAPPSASAVEEPTPSAPRARSVPEAGRTKGPWGEAPRREHSGLRYFPLLNDLKLYVYIHHGQKERVQPIVDDIVGKIEEVTGLPPTQIHSLVDENVEKRFKDEALMGDADARDAFRADVEKTFDIEPLDYGPTWRREYSTIAETHSHLIEEVHSFKEWQTIFKGLDTWHVAELANLAAKKPHSRAGNSVAFWNAVIDDLITVAIVSPALSDKQREGNRRMAEYFQEAVRAMLKGDSRLPDIEKAWAMTVDAAEVTSLLAWHRLHMGWTDVWGRDIREA